MIKKPTKFPYEINEERKLIMGLGKYAKANVTRKKILQTEIKH